MSAACPRGYGILGPQPAPAPLPGVRWHRTPHHPSRPPVPTAAPRNVAVHGATATQLDVTWEPPPLESQNGDIQGYKVRGPQGHRARLGVGSDPREVGTGVPGLPLPPWLFAHRPQQYRGAGAKLSRSAMSEGRLSSDARHSGHAWLVSLPGGTARTPAHQPPNASVGPRQVAMWPTLITTSVLTGCPVRKGPLRLGNLYLEILSDFGMMSHVTTGVGLSLRVTKPFRTP